MDLVRTPKVERPLFPGDHRTEIVYKGPQFDESLWDGSDFFRVDIFYVITRRVQRVLKRAKLKNVKIEPLAEAAIDASTVDNYPIDP